MIRNMLKSDTARILAMMQTFYNSPAVLSNGSEEIFKNDIENCLNDCPYLEGYVFTQKAHICGYMMVAKSFSTEFGKPCIWIEDLYIEPAYRGLGIGKQFLQYIEQKYSGCVLRLEAESDNRNAIRLYEKCGYEALPYLEMVKRPN